MVNHIAIIDSTTKNLLRVTPKIQFSYTQVGSGEDIAELDPPQDYKYVGQSGETQCHQWNATTLTWSLVPQP